jgi:predicted phage tail component-like protein
VGYVNPQALYFNGHCPDKEIEGFQTKSVAGRELMAHTLTALIVGNQDGEREQLSRYASRDIKVSYTLEASTATDLRDKYRALNVLLMGQNKQIWFGDDPDYYFVGTLSAADTPTDGMLKVTSTFTLHCPLPFAYAMREDSFVFNNAGRESMTLDFAGKVFGDFKNNPNLIQGCEKLEIESRPPDSLWWEWDQGSYDRIARQDNACGSYAREKPGNSTRLIMRYDVVKWLDLKVPGIWQSLGLVERDDQISWLGNHLKKFYTEVWSWGKGASGFGVKVQYWNGTEWTGTEANLAYIPTKNQYSLAGQAAATAMSDGYFYVLTGTNDADAATPSVIFLDYAKLDITIDLPTSNTLMISNEGPLPVPIRFELTNHDDNGYFTVANKSESTTIGKPSDVDGGQVDNSERLFTRDNTNANGLKQWTLNAGVINEWNEIPVQSGSFEDPAVIKEKAWRLRNKQSDITTAWGAGDPSGRGWHGPSASCTFPADSKGAVGAKNWTARWYAQFLFPNMKATGIQQFNIWGPDKELIISVQMWKDVGKHGSIEIRIGNQWAYKDLNNARWDNFFGPILIKRFGNTYTITLQNVDGSGPKTKQTLSYTDAASAAILAAGMTYWKARWGNTTKYNTVMYNDMYDFWFTKDNVETYVDIPNLFSEGDKVIIDGQDGKATTTINGALDLSMQHIGSQPVLAYPGQTAVTLMYSDFASTPDCTAYIRRKYL